LSNPHEHAGNIYDLTGPEALTFDEVTSIIAESSKKATFNDETIEEGYTSPKSGSGTLASQRLGLYVYTAIKFGALDEVKDHRSQSYLVRRIPVQLGE